MLVLHAIIAFYVVELLVDPIFDQTCKCAICFFLPSAGA